MTTHRYTLETRDHHRWRYRWQCSCGAVSHVWSATEGIAAGAHRKHVAQASKARAMTPTIDEHY